MKKNFIVSLATFVVFATGASAASKSDVFTLPTVVVEAPAYNAAERAVYSSLQSLKAKTAAPTSVTIELPALKTQVTQTTQSRGVVRLAKY